MTAWPPPALVLTAGLGTRLRPLTTRRAKPALPVGDEALVCRILRHLAAQGIREAVLNLHHLPETITREVGDGSQCGLRVRYSWEQPQVLGSAGGPRHALPLVDAETVLIVNGDTLCNLPLRALWDAHRAMQAEVTLGLMHHPVAGRYGGVGLDGRGRVTGFPRRGSEPAGWHFPGIQIVETRVLAQLPDGTPAETVREVYPALMAQTPEAVCGAVFEADWDDIGTVEDYRRTCRRLAGDDRGNVIDATAVVDPTAELSDCVVWPSALVGARCVLDRVVVTGETPVTADTHAENCVI